MLPNTRYKRLPHHKYDVNGFALLKMTALYGANAAGKSNLVKAMSLLIDIVTFNKIPPRFSDTQFKFRDEKYEDQILAIEFFQNEIPFYYALKINKGIIKTEELYISGLGKNEDKLIFERNTNEEGKTTLQFLPEFENDAESQVLKRVIQKNLAKPNEPIFYLLSDMDNPFLKDINVAFHWFGNTLLFEEISGQGILAHAADNNDEHRNYAEDLIKSFHVGISNLEIQTHLLEDFLIENKLIGERDFEEFESDGIPVVHVLETEKGEFVAITKENHEWVVKQIRLKHFGKNNKTALFDLYEESDGTVRLLDFVSHFRDIIFLGKTIIIDEIEKSLHPLIIKELIRKFSHEKNTNGQLIFTTHESNLLDQDIFRRDEIWFAEKDKDGCTDLYSLSDYKEHNTIDIRKGYLMGRYGAIPFLGNLKDLNWHVYDTSETQTV